MSRKKKQNPYQEPTAPWAPPFAASAATPPPVTVTQEHLVADGRRWRRVRAPRPWKPRQVGDVLVGTVLARAVRPGSEGSSYGVTTLQTEDGAVTISGVVISSLFDAAGELASNVLVRVVYLGEQVSAANRTYKDFELYVCVADGEKRWARTDS